MLLSVARYTVIRALRDPFLGPQIDIPTPNIGNVYVADRDNNQRVRKVTVSTGIITTIAGTDTPGDCDDNCPATSVALANVGGIALGSSGNSIIFIYLVCCIYFAHWNL